MQQYQTKKEYEQGLEIGLGIHMARCFACLDCGFDCHSDEGGEYYMVHDRVWKEARPEDWGMLCVGCLEKRLGRRLTPRDFTGAPVNNPHVKRKSDRILSRMRETHHNG